MNEESKERLYKIELTEVGFPLRREPEHRSHFEPRFFYASSIVTDSAVALGSNADKSKNKILMFIDKYPIEANSIFNFSFSLNTDNALFNKYFATDKRQPDTEGFSSPLLTFVYTQELYAADVRIEVVYLHTIIDENNNDNDRLNIVARADKDCEIGLLYGTPEYPIKN